MAARGEQFVSQQLADGQFYGDIHQATRASGLVFSELDHAEARYIPEHSHKLSYFTLVLGGHYEEGPRHHLAGYDPFTLIFNPAGVEHEGQIAAGGAKFFTVELEDSWIAALDGRRLHYTTSDLNAGRGLWLALRLRQEHASCTLTAESLMWELLAELARWNSDRVPNRPRWWGQVEEVVRLRFRENFSFNSLAREAGIHPVHLARTYRRVEGRTLGEYVQALRVRYACKLLQDRALPLADVAIDSGFADQSHFTRMFRKFVGTTPARFRATLSR